ncbi:protealysin inhibitor emfourin [Costertonia aggregata]|uniref:Uncharacterized protein n=1 Tax=Costertonia aggregata TaxID=343403 RepID=A0A7H9AUP5_9FLAO|nr:protealysin inhibitor emfourin [Costertonia aggregata]QLG46915.1 hypothetical protein HYG79_16660 [Costertonia aggregata]
MNYTIQIEGGFTGIPQFYEGELELTENERSQLLDIFKKEKNDQSDASMLRDGLQYHIKFIEGDMDMEYRFSEKNLPDNLRILIDKIRLKNDR